MLYKQKKTEKIKSYRKYKYNTSLAYVPNSMCCGGAAIKEIRLTRLLNQKTCAALNPSSSNWLLFPLL